MSFRASTSLLRATLRASSTPLRPTSACPGCSPSLRHLSSLTRRSLSSASLVSRAPILDQTPNPQVHSVPPPAPAPAPVTPKRRVVRPRKAALSLTPGAITRIRSLLSLPEPKLIRVGVKNKGCAGMAYHLEYVDKPDKFDEVVEQDGVKVVIDSKALFSIIGSEMDWQEDALQARFVFNNPNIKDACGCGESFIV